MSSRVVGKDVKIYDIIKTIESASSPPSLTGFADKWSEVAMSLETRRDLVKTLRQKRLLQDDFQTKELAYELLDDWHRRVGDLATIQELINVFEYNELKNYSEALFKKFCQSPAAPPPPNNQAAQFEKQKAHIKKHLHELIGMTNLYADIIAFIEARGFLGDGDVALLDSLHNKLEKNREFYKILQNKPGSYEVLIEAMENATQTGVANLLKRWNL